MSASRHAKPRRAAGPAERAPRRSGGRHKAPAQRGPGLAPVALGAAAVAVAAGGGIAVAGPDPAGAARAVGFGASESFAPAGSAPSADRATATRAASRSGERADLSAVGAGEATRPDGPAAGADRDPSAAANAADAVDAADVKSAEDAEGTEDAQSGDGAPAEKAEGTNGAADIGDAAHAARERAQEALADRIADVERKAAAAARRAGPPRLFAGCGYSASIQERPKLDGAQLRNVRTIVKVAKEMGLSPRAAVIALATAHQESWLRNLGWGDRDSLGLFQQRPSMGWGSPDELQTPEYAARAFYVALKDVDGWERMPVTVAAQRVQRSAFPLRYAQWELMAATLVDDILDVPNAALNCARG